MSFQQIATQLKQKQYTWVVTGVAGFIGSNLLEYLLTHNQKVIGLDNFSTGYLHNLEEVRGLVSDVGWDGFTFIEGDIRDFATCQTITKDADFVLHQAALGSVPRSIDNPINTNESNISGFLNMLVAAKENNVQSFVYAASSSTYGDHPALPKVEENIGNPLSPYAVTKLVNELYANVFAKVYNYKTVGLRYFNVFGARQNPNGAYAAVIPTWARDILNSKPLYINGDGETSRDFCYVKNAIQANVLAAFADEDAKGEVYNVAFNNQTSLNQLKDIVVGELNNNLTGQTLEVECEYRDFRQGDVRHSLADISKAQKLLGYSPTHNVKQGVAEAMPWYIKYFKKV